MDRSEAYSLLTDEMTKLTRLGRDELITLVEAGMEVERTGDSGVYYRINLSVERMADPKFAVIGAIHDNSTFRHSLLKERLEFDAHDNE